MKKKIISKRVGPGSEQFQLRLPDGMRKQLAEVAEREGRSMNVVIISALATYFERSAGIETTLKELVDLAIQHHELLTQLLLKGDIGAAREAAEDAARAIKQKLGGQTNGDEGRKEEK